MFSFYKTLLRPYATVNLGLHHGTAIRMESSTYSRILIDVVIQNFLQKINLKFENYLLLIWTQQNINSSKHILNGEWN